LIPSGDEGKNPRSDVDKRTKPIAKGEIARGKLVRGKGCLGVRVERVKLEGGNQNRVI